MNELNLRTWMDPQVNRETWAAGPWDDEPDKMQWTDEATGLPCLIKRNSIGALCGYVGVTRDHPLYETCYTDAETQAAIDVHGGLTYSDKCQDGPDPSTICHLPEPGEPDDVWWFGFDCGHGWDYWPGMPDVFRNMSPAYYRDVAYVQGQITELAKQLVAAREAPQTAGAT